MDGIRVEAVDERDSSWEDSRPHFRVYLHCSGETETHGGTATYDVRGADLLQVVDWAQRQAGGHLTYAVALVTDRHHRRPEDGRGLIWLVGRDGNDLPWPADHPGVHDGLLDSQRRMLARRHHPVGIPDADRMPDDVPDLPGAPHIFVEE